MEESSKQVVVWSRMRLEDIEGKGVEECGRFNE